MLDVEGKVKFIGYEKARGQGKILALLDEDGKPVDSLTEGMKATVVSGFHPLLRRKWRAGGRQRRNRPRQIAFSRSKTVKKRLPAQFLHLGR